MKVFPNGSLRVFLCDHGYFMDLYRDNEVKLIDLPNNLQQPSEIIFEGSLAVQPCDTVQDRETETVINSPVRHYDQRAIAFVQKYNVKKAGVGLDWRLVLIKKEANTYFGDLLLKNPLETMSLSEELIKQNLAIPCTEMKLDQQPLELRPSSNFKKIIMRCCPELMTQNPMRTTEPSAKLLPIGVQQRRVDKSREPQNVPKPTSRVDKSREPQNVPKKPSVLFPTDILVFGEHLYPAFKSVETTTFTTEMKSHLKTNSSMMTKLQSHAWPQISHGRSIVIVPASGSSPVLSPMTFLPPLLNNIIVKVGEVAGAGPTAIIVAKSSSDVKEIMRFCTRLAPHLKIDVLGFETKAVQLINGCDLLLSTPLAFVRIVEGSKINLFNRDRIRTLVLHEADKIVEKFDPEVNEIVRRCTHGHKNVDKNPQIIVTSNVWFKNIEKFKLLIAPSKLNLCVESFIEAAAVCGIKIVLEISTNNETKFASMCNDFKSGNYKNKRTVVVVNDEKSFKYLKEKFGEGSIQVSLADQSNFENVKTTWLREKTGKHSVLIATDATIGAMQLSRVQDLVHFSIPATWSTFAHRFSTLISNFYEVLEKKIEPNSMGTKIFIDEEKNVREFAHLVKFMQLRKMESIPATMIESLEVGLLSFLFNKYLNDCFFYRSFQTETSISSAIIKFQFAIKFGCLENV